MQEYRDIIRSSWGRPTMPGVQTRWVITVMIIIVMMMVMMMVVMMVVRLVFMLGITTETRLQEEILQESRDHGDIVQVQEMSSSLHYFLHAFSQGNFLDTYRNLTYKSVMGHLWVR